jgi:hypothetical protein
VKFDRTASKQLLFFLLNVERQAGASTTLVEPSPYLEDYSQSSSQEISHFFKFSD